MVSVMIPFFTPRIQRSLPAFKRALLLGLMATSLMLGACGEYKKVNDAVKSNEQIADNSFEQLSPARGVAQPLTVDKRPWFGSEAVPILNGQALPANFERSNSVVLTFARPVTLPEMARMIQSVTGIRATAEAENNSNGVSKDVATFMPSDGELVSGGRVVWQGRLSDLLNQAADVYGADWTYDGNVIRFSSQITRTFMLHALASAVKTSGTIKSGASDTGGSTPELDIEAKDTLEIWKEIEASIKTILNSTGEAAFSPSTGTITVRSTPDIVRRIETYLNQQNAMRLRRVSVGVKVLSIVTKNDYTLGLDIEGAIRNATGNSAFKITPTSDGGSQIGILRNMAGTGVNANSIVTELSGLQGIERVSIVHSGAVVTLSDMPAPLQVGRQTAYAKRTSSTTTGTSGNSISIEPGTINSGLMMSILPRIVDNNKILMRLSVSISDLSLPIKSFGPTGNQIQLPEIDTTGFLQNAVVTSGETLVMAGFEKNINSGNDTGTPGFILGGTRKTSRAREITVLLLTSEIMPEEPVTVIGQ